MNNNDNLPTVVKDGTFNIFGVDIKCHVLSDGRRVIEEESIVKLFETMGNSDAKIDESELEQFVKWSRGK